MELTVVEWQSYEHDDGTKLRYELKVELIEQLLCSAKFTSGSDIRVHDPVA